MYVSVTALVVPNEKQIKKKRVAYAVHSIFFQTVLYHFNRQQKIQQISRNVNTVPILLTKFAFQGA